MYIRKIVSKNLGPIKKIQLLSEAPVIRTKSRDAYPRFVLKLKQLHPISTVKSFRSVLLSWQAVLLLSRLVLLPRQR